ncbi:hypothetical protein SNEBB_004522 [Seison nebaliae]|nr:hypothetical protein SNEBB_004522 [Seison nebaliae]
MSCTAGICKSTGKCLSNPPQCNQKVPSAPPAIDCTPAKMSVPCGNPKSILSFQKGSHKSSKTDKKCTNCGCICDPTLKVSTDMCKSKPHPDIP